MIYESAIGVAFRSSRTSPRSGNRDCARSGCANCA